MRERRWIRHTVFALLVLLAWGWLQPAVEGVISDCGDLSQHMEFVWMVPVLSGLLLWLRRKRIAASLGAPEPWLACPLILLAAGLLFLGLRGGQTRFCQLAAVLLLLALPLACYGRKTLREIWFPILLLAFVMPVGFLDNFTVPLRRASVTVTAFLLNGLGVPVKQSGTAILSAGSTPFQLDVADPCSGIRSLVALFVGTAAYGAVTLKSIWGRWVLFGASLPIAFLGNILRLLATALTCCMAGQAAGLILHDNALFFIAPVYAAAVFGLADWLRKKETSRPERTLTPESITPISRRVWAGWVCLAAGLPLFGLYARHQPPLIYESDAFLRPAFSALPGMEMFYPWFCQNRLCLWSGTFPATTPPPKVCPQCGGELQRITRAELDILPADTQNRKVTYRLENGDVFTVALVIAGRNRMSIHRPELCLPAQGFVMSERRVREILPGVPMACFSLTREQQSGRSGFAYLFIHASGATVSNLQRVVGDAWERSIHNRIQRWAMLTVSSPQHDFQTPDGEAALRRFMRLFYPTLWTNRAHD